jgi:nuclease S1
MLLVALTGSSDLAAWGLQGHRVVALLAAARLAPETRLIVDSLLPGTSLADVAVWADDYVADNIQTGPWHYVNIPAEATQYDRDRDCPRQPGVAAGSRADRWRDCVVDRILYHQQRLADATLDRADRAIALKFLVHFVGDLHQPLHAIDTARGGNDLPVVVFGFPTCRSSSGAMNPCNLHGVWDTALIAHRQLSDEQYLAELSRQIAASKWDAQPVGTPQDWAMESHTLAKVALLTPRSAVNEAYYRAHTDAVDRRLALAGLRLAALLNQSLAAAPRP